MNLMGCTFGSGEGRPSATANARPAGSSSAASRARLMLFANAAHRLSKFGELDVVLGEFTVAVANAAPKAGSIKVSNISTKLRLPRANVSL